MKEVFAALLAYRQKNVCCVLVSVVGGEGSAPRKTQSHMLVDGQGRVCGTVGGGAVEGNSIAYALQLLEKRESAIKTFELYEKAAEDIGMICGGRVRVHFQWISPDDDTVREIARAAVSAFEDGRDAWLVIDVHRHALALCSEAFRIGACVPETVFAQRNAGSVTCAANGTEYYAEQLTYSDRVYIFGGGHVAQALVPMLSFVDFRCVVIEDREEFCQKSLFPQAKEVLLIREDEWKNTLHVGSGDCICIMTRGHRSDLACQAFALETEAAYIGVIGSRRKVAAVNAQLRDMGFGEDQISRIVTPIGLDIGAVTPAEIAVSIAAQLIAHRAGRRKESMKKSCMA